MRRFFGDTFCAIGQPHAQDRRTMLDSTTSSAATPLGAFHRKLIVAIVFGTLLAWTVVVVDLARGGRADPPELRAAATLLDGTWRFHTGDDPRWADVDTDDAAWDTINMTAAPGSHDGDVGLPDYVGGWMAQGHPGYHGYAWYRRAVTVPVTPASWYILGPTLVEDGYELYWNGKLLGGSGRIDNDPHIVGTRPTRFALPADAAGSRGVLAVRAYKLPGGSSADGGGMHSPPMLAPQTVGEGLHSAQWQRTIAGYIVEVIEPLAMLAVIALALAFLSRSNRRHFVVFACIALAFMAARRLNNAIVAWTDLMDLRTYSWLASTMWVPMLTAWTLAWNRWCLPPWRSIDAGAAVLAIVGILGAVTHSAHVATGARLGFLALVVVLGARIIRSRQSRILALATLASIIAAFFGGELLDPIGVPGIWFPFGIGVSRTQFVYALLIPLVAFSIVRTLASTPLDRSRKSA
jgi:hypothetical protein